MCLSRRQTSLTCGSGKTPDVFECLVSTLIKTTTTPVSFSAKRPTWHPLPRRRQQPQPQPQQRPLQQQLLQQEGRHRHLGGPLQNHILNQVLPAAFSFQLLLNIKFRGRRIKLILLLNHWSFVLKVTLRMMPIPVPTINQEKMICRTLTSFASLSLTSIWMAIPVCPASEGPTGCRRPIESTQRLT